MFCIIMITILLGDISRASLAPRDASQSGANWSRALQLQVNIIHDSADDFMRLEVDVIVDTTASPLTRRAAMRGWKCLLIRAKFNEMLALEPHMTMMNNFWKLWMLKLFLFSVKFDQSRPETRSFAKQWNCEITMNWSLVWSDWIFTFEFRSCYAPLVYCVIYSISSLQSFLLFQQ